MLDIEARDLEGALRHAERALAIYDQHDGVEQGELEARSILAALLAGTDPDRARALEAQARAGWDALGRGGARDRADMEAWLRRATSEGKLRDRSRRLIATPRATQ
jgi:hypothetical protein